MAMNGRRKRQGAVDDKQQEIRRERRETSSPQTVQKPSRKLILIAIKLLSLHSQSDRGAESSSGEDFGKASFATGQNRGQVKPGAASFFTRDGML